MLKGKQHQAVGRFRMNLLLARRLAALILVAAILSPAAAQARADERDELDARITRLIDQLGDKEYAVRQRAQLELGRLGFTAFDALSDAEQSDDIEIATQAKYLVRLIRADWTNDNAPPQVRTLLKDYDFQNETTRLARMKALLELPGDGGLEWLCRLVRFEQSPVLSKQAALLIVSQDPQPDDASWAKRTTTIAKTLDRSNRPAARLLRAYVQMRNDPQAGLAEWADLITAEKQALADHPQQTDVRIVAQLLRTEVDQLQAVMRNAEALVVMRDMVALERGEAQSLAELVNWLAKRRAWAAIDDVAVRFGSNFDGSAQLLYTLAQALEAEGKTAQAEEAAQKALAINPERDEEHFQIARFLQSRGLHAWSEGEYRYLIGMKRLSSRKVFHARRTLAENLHDRQQDREAGEVLQGAVEILEKDTQLADELHSEFDLKVESVRSRTDYFLAKSYARQNDRGKERELLEKAVEQDPADADVLISLYHFPGLEAERKAQIVELVRAAVQESRNKIAEEPDSSTPYNQLAWLVCNTEGDFDDAVRLSRKSVELARAAVALAQGRSEWETMAASESLGGHLDTLAHCYAAKQDFEEAVKTQAEAAKLIPHSQQIVRKLEEFQRSLAEQQRGKQP
jgi:tetratricopeptide (TPR) repeat protein